MRKTLALLVCAGGLAAAQNLVYPPPPDRDVEIRKSIEYSSGLAMDVYLPSKRDPKVLLPIVIFMNGISDESMRESTQYVQWCKVATAQGFAAIVPVTGKDVETDYDSIATWIARHAGEIGVDAAQIGVWACSAHVSRTFPMIEDPKRTSVKSAVIYYGYGKVVDWRFDLPVLMVRAGLDGAGLNRGMADLAASALKANAPVTMLNYPAGHHGFDLRDDNDTSRAMILTTLQFLKSTLSPRYQAAMRKDLGIVGASSAASKGDFETAVRLYQPAIAEKPDDAQLHLAYGQALTGAKRYREALAIFEKLRGKPSVGPRDLGVPAAKAAALAGESEKAVEWLRSIPSRFMPADLLNDPAFSSLQGSVSFEALKKR